MIRSYDTGSLPFEGDFQKYLAGAQHCEASELSEESARHFETIVVKSFIDKIRTGIDIPNYPQFRDMTQMFLTMTDGLERIEGGYIELETLRLKQGKGSIAELITLKKYLHEIFSNVQKQINIRACITGPFTLSAMFPYRRNDTFQQLGNILAQILEKNIFTEKYGEVSLISIDEPAFGLIDDPLMDRGSAGRETLLNAWERISHTAKTRNVESCLHLHSSADDLFWQATSLDVIEFPIEDPIYKMKQTKQRLEETDKFLKASVCITDFDQLIKNYMKSALPLQPSESTLNEAIANTWKDIRNGKVDPIVFVEDVSLMKKRLVTMIETFGAERVPYAAPECGLRGFPTYACALECLKKVVQTCKEF